MPFAVTHINLWAIEDGDGWSIVDTGVQDPATYEAWRTLFDGPLKDRPVTRVLLTHMHPDHSGMAGWITRKFDCDLWMTRLEYLTCRVLCADVGIEAPDRAIRFYREAGWNDGAIDIYRMRFGDFGRHIHAFPDSFRRLQDGDRFIIGNFEWRVIVGRGHSPEHACICCDELGLFISGDQVLPRISSNVSVFPTEPDADPVADWSASISKLECEVPDDVLVLPSHNEPFRNLHARLDYLRVSQERSLDRVLSTLIEPKRVVDLFVSLFSRDVAADPLHLNLATGETIALLNHLLGRGEIEKRQDEAGVGWYSRV